jgi:hypothetical protein
LNYKSFGEWEGQRKGKKQKAKVRGAKGKKQKAEVRGAKG